MGANYDAINSKRHTHAHWGNINAPLPEIPEHLKIPQRGRKATEKQRMLIEAIAADSDVVPIVSGHIKFTGTGTPEQLAMNSRWAGVSDIRTGSVHGCCGMRSIYGVNRNGVLPIDMLNKMHEMGNGAGAYLYIDAVRSDNPWRIAPALAELIDRYHLGVVTAGAPYRNPNYSKGALIHWTFQPNWNQLRGFLSHVPGTSMYKQGEW